MTKISGVYKITNKITGDFYIGSSKDIKHRWTNHKSASTWKRYPNVRLYQAMTQFGRDNFEFEILEETTELKLKEQYWIEQLNPSYNDRRSNGFDFERFKEYYQTEKVKEIRKRYNDQLCLYNDETITLNTLSSRFRRQGIPHPILEAKKYLISN